MFSDTVSGELPEHKRFIYETAIPYFEKCGILTRVLRGLKTYLDCFYRIVSRGNAEGKLASFPLTGRCSIQRDCKLPPIRTYALSGAGWYETATGQQRYYTPLPTETPPSGYQAGTAQIGVYLTVPSGFSQPVVAYLQNMYTGDIYELNLYDANGMAAAMPQAVSGKYAYLSARVAGDTAGRYQIESEQAVLLAGDGVDFHLTVTDTEQPNRTMQTPSRGQVR